MSERAADVLKQALELSNDERAGVALELLQSLEPLPAEDPAAVAAAWAVEIEERAHRALANPSGGENWETVRERTARILKSQ
jgi:hypothetical protein